MKNIYLNLKRFDVPRADGGVNDLAYGNDYADAIVKKLESLDGVDFTVFFQEAYLIEACKINNRVNIGCQSVFYDDVEENKNFGAFTTFRTAKSMKALGVNSVLIGHCEERNYLNRLNKEFGGKGDINSSLPILTGRYGFQASGNHGSFNRDGIFFFFYLFLNSVNLFFYFLSFISVSL